MPRGRTLASSVSFATLTNTDWDVKLLGLSVQGRCTREHICTPNVKLWINDIDFMNVSLTSPRGKRLAGGHGTTEALYRAQEEPQKCISE